MMLKSAATSSQSDMSDAENINALAQLVSLAKTDIKLLVEIH